MKIEKLLIGASWFLTASLLAMTIICIVQKDWTRAICNVLWMFISLIQTRNIYKLQEREIVQAKLNKMIEKAGKVIENLESKQ